MGSNSGRKGKTSLEVGADGVAIISIDNPPLNLLSVDVLLSLKETTDQALKRDDVKAVVITGSKHKFSGGFDVTVFGKKVRHERPGFLSIDFITDTLEAARKPLVAAVDGIALGGGLEIALACHARISTPSAQLGLTELRYGILPGLGGTQRLPRLVGLWKALEMMLMSKLVNGDEAHNLGLVDAMGTTENLVDTACCWALDIYHCRKPWVASLYRTDKIEPLSDARLILKQAREHAKVQSPNLRHPLVCIDVIEEGVASSPRVGLWKESEALLELRQSDACKSLVHFFLAQHNATKIPGITDLGLVPRKVNTVAVVGGGLMGSGIATALILSKYAVILKEANEKFLSAGIDRIKANLQNHVEKRKLTQKQSNEIMLLLTGVLDYEFFGNVDVVIEAASTDMSIKQKIFADLEKNCPSHCIFASSTSAINLNLISERKKCENRIVGAYFFSPADVMPLLEIVRTEKTSPQVVVDLINVGKKLKKTPILVGNCTGFAVNRMFFPFLQVAAMLVEHGVDIYHIDWVITNFGMRMGPFRMMDHVSPKASITSGIQYTEKFPDRSYKSVQNSVMQQDKRAGETTLSGFYNNSEHKATPDPAIWKHVRKAKGISGIVTNYEWTKISDQDIVEMMLFPVVNEACRLLEEGIVVKASDLDVAAVMGMDFPAYRGGIIFWANSFGSRHICSKLEEWSTKYGALFTPCAHLSDTASKGVSLGTLVHTKSQL